MKTSHGVFLEYDSSSRSTAPNFIISKEVRFAKYCSIQYNKLITGLSEEISIQNIDEIEDQ